MLMPRSRSKGAQIKQPAERGLNLSLKNVYRRIKVYRNGHGDYKTVGLNNISGFLSAATTTADRSLARESLYLVVGSY
jgi:hypothetical protein